MTEQNYAEQAAEALAGMPSHPPAPPHSAGQPKKEDEEEEDNFHINLDFD